MYPKPTGFAVIFVAMRSSLSLHGMSSKTLNEDGKILREIVLISTAFKHEKCRMFTSILKAVLKSAAAERCACSAMTSLLARSRLRGPQRKIQNILLQ